eukprot:8284153-Prorocentrum_lima.AAC.1
MERPPLSPAFRTMGYPNARTVEVQVWALIPQETRHPPREPWVRDSRAPRSSGRKGTSLRRGNRSPKQRPTWQVKEQATGDGRGALPSSRARRRTPA